jgi:hypothetical protein
MPSDDRERSFENALARHLRPAASRDACSDAETLAAYHEQSLAPELMASLKAHVSDCARCQQVLAHLQATDEIPMAAASIAQPRSAAAKSAVRILPARRPTLWRWVAPAGALAAALLVWVAVRENKPIRVAVQQPKGEISQTQIATVQPASPSPLPPPSPDATRKSELSASTDLSPSGTAQPSPSRIAPIPQRPQSLAKEKDLQSTRKKSFSAEGVGGGLAGAAAKLATPSPSQASLQPQVPGSVSETVTVESADNEIATTPATGDELARTGPETKSTNDKRGAPSSRSASPTPAVAGAAPVPAPPTASEPAPRATTQTVEVMSEAAEVKTLPMHGRDVADLTTLNQGAQLLLASTTAGVTISAPGGRVSWRIGQAGIILFSSDAGKKWLVQPSGIIADLLAGSAPSAKVCWIVGRNGTILRTTDKGKHWNKVKPPTQDDFVSVFAVNARQATVSPPAGTYQTTDGGATWSKLPPE